MYNYFIFSKKSGAFMAAFKGETATEALAQWKVEWEKVASPEDVYSEDDWIVDSV